MNTKKPLNSGRDPNRKDWHEQRIEKGRATEQKPADDKATLGGSQQRVGSPSKDHNQAQGRSEAKHGNQSGSSGLSSNAGAPGPNRGAPSSLPTGQPGDQDHGREHEQARKMQGTEGSQPSSGDQRPGRKPDESGQSGAQRIEQRTQRPGEAGLANENRPGLGTRADPTSNQPEAQGKGGTAEQPAQGPAKGGTRSVQQGTDKPRPQPNEQRSDSLEQEQQRSTGMSGQSTGV